MRRSPVIKRSIVVRGRRTSISLEDEFWSELKEIAERSKMSRYKLVGKIEARRSYGGLSSAIRIYVLKECQKQRDKAVQGERNILNSWRASMKMAREM